MLIADGRRLGLGDTGPHLNDRRSVNPDSVRGLFDDMHELLRKIAKLEAPLQCIGHLFQRALIISDGEQAVSVCE
jgi:hypothetical protein